MCGVDDNIAPAALPFFSEYAQVTKMLGNGRLEKRLAHIRGKMRKKVRTAATALPEVIVLDR
jgi:hypothetical protein